MGQRLAVEGLSTYKQLLKSGGVSECSMPASGIEVSGLPRRQLIGVLLVVAIQAVAALYFMIDGIDDFIAQAENGIGLEVVMDGVVALALIAGLVVGAHYARTMTEELRRKEMSLEIARGALSEQITIRFAKWGLTTGEAEVALFAMKGFNIAEIARLRGAAAGTVRAQLSQVYAKAGVSSQSMLVSLFIEDLLDAPVSR
jgi:DNA-binding CsgD family transcriptional regulator